MVVWEMDNINSWDCNELWNAFSTLMMEEDEEGFIMQRYIKEYRQIKNGFEIPLSIRYFANKWYESYPTYQIVIVANTWKYDMESFYNEKEKREILMRKILIENNETLMSSVSRN